MSNVSYTHELADHTQPARAVSVPLSVELSLVRCKAGGERMGLNWDKGRPEFKAVSGPMGASA